MSRVQGAVLPASGDDGIGRAMTNLVEDNREIVAQKGRLAAGHTENRKVFVEEEGFLVLEEVSTTKTLVQFHG